MKYSDHETDDVVYSIQDIIIIDCVNTHLCQSVVT